ncbi:uncharacterized protein LOC144582948 [Callithrix jacchus]
MSSAPELRVRPGGWHLPPGLAGAGFPALRGWLGGLPSRTLARAEEGAALRNATCALPAREVSPRRPFADSALGRAPQRSAPERGRRVTHPPPTLPPPKPERRPLPARAFVTSAFIRVRNTNVGIRIQILGARRGQTHEAGHGPPVSPRHVGRRCTLISLGRHEPRRERDTPGDPSRDQDTGQVDQLDQNARMTTESPRAAPGHNSELRGPGKEEGSCGRQRDSGPAPKMNLEVHGPVDAARWMRVAWVCQG